MGDIAAAGALKVPVKQAAAPLQESATAIREKPCRHRRAESYCLTPLKGKCCSCNDRSYRPTGNLSAAAKDAIAVVAAATRTKLSYQDYCQGCFDHFAAIDARRAEEKRAAFAKWRRKPHTNMELTKLSANFNLRKAGFPCEITHLILSFALKVPLVNFFRTFDRPDLKFTNPGYEGIKINGTQAATLNKTTSQSREAAQRKSKSCKHEFCESKVRFGTPGWCYYTNKKIAPMGCCACADARPNKRVDVVYVDGKGNFLKQVDFHAYYCAACKDHWADRPNEDPHGENGISAEEVLASRAPTAGGPKTGVTSFSSRSARQQ